MIAVSSQNEAEKSASSYESINMTQSVEKKAGVDQNKRKQFERLFIPLTDNLYNMALRMTRNHNDAEDLVQETYLKAYRFFNNFRTNTNARAWIMTIMMNTFRTGYRKSQKEPVRIDYDAVANFLPGDANEPAKQPANKSEMRNIENITEYMRSVVSDDIIDALESVPIRFRVPVLLSDAEQFNYQEISEILGINIGTVKSRIFRGRRLLKKNLFEFAVSRGIYRK